MEFATILNLAVSLFTLTVLELVLGVDNLVFIAVISNRLPEEKQKFARRFGLSLALITRILLLASAYWLIHLNQPLFHLFSIGFSGRDIFLFLGGLFLLYKGTQEMHAEFSVDHKDPKLKKQHKTWAVILQIAVLDIIFSLDTVITAVGMTEHFWIMVTAIVIAIIGMIFISEPLAAFIKKYPTVRMLAFSFLLMVGMVLMADGLHYHIPRGYLYFAVAFSIFVEFMNILRQRRQIRRNPPKNPLT